MSCLEAGHILSNGRKITIFCFSSAASSVKSEIPAKFEFSQLFEDNTCAQLASYSYLFKILVTGFLYKRLSGPYGEFQPIPIYKINSHYPPDYSQYGDRLFSPFSSQPSFDRAFATCGLTLFRS